MANIIPNDLSHMSDEDFNALCPQGHHAPGPEPLSPAAQTVLAAYYCEKPLVGSKRIAAALRAAALYSYCPMDRQRLAAIATELEGVNG